MLHLTPSKNTKHTNQNTKNAIPMKNSANQNTKYPQYGYTLFCQIVKHYVIKSLCRT